MAYTMLSVNDFLGMEFKSNMSRMNYLLAVSEVFWLKSMYGEEDNLVAEQDEEYRIKKQEKITQNIESILLSFPTVLDHQEKPTLDIVIPRRKRSLSKSRPRKVTEQFFCNGGELMIKKAVENNSEEQEHKVKADNGENKRITINSGAGVSNEKFFRLKKSQKHEEEENRVKVVDDKGNREFKISLKGSVNFVFENPIIRKRSREVANNPLRFNNQERLLNIKFVEKEEGTSKKQRVKRNITARAEVPVRELDIVFKNMITEIGGSIESAELVIEKRLFDSDVRPSMGRFLIPQNKCSKFLKPEEDAHLDTRNGAKMCEMNVMLIEPSLQISQINLRKWFMNKDNGKANINYVLVTHWNEVTKRNALGIGTMVQLWAFRKDEKLCFALVKLRG